MKKSRIFKVIAAAMALSMLLSVTSFADALNDAHFDFEQMMINLAPGDVCKFSVYVDDLSAYYSPDEPHNTYSMYCVGNNDSKTYCWSDFKTGFSTVEIHISPNETAKRVTVHFYVDGTDVHDCVDINIVSPEKSYVKETREKAIKAKMNGVTMTTAVDPVTIPTNSATVAAAAAAKSLKDLKVPTDEEIAKMPLEDQLAWYYLVLSYKQAGK